MNMIITLMTLVCLTFSAAVLSEESGNSISEVYVGSSNLPDHVAYQIFLIKVRGHGSGMNHIDDYLARVLGIDNQTDEAAAKINVYKTMFVDEAFEIERQIDSKMNQIFCSEDWSSMSFDETVDGVYEEREFREQIYTDHYEAAMSVLSKEERSAFQAYLDETKLSTSHTQHDSRKYYKERPDELRKYHLSICAPEMLETDGKEKTS